jgi:hypothetical protein
MKTNSHLLLALLIAMLIFTSCQEDQVLNQPPTDISISSNSIQENESIGTVVGQLTVSDSDANDNHTFTLIAGLDFFTVNGNNLESKVSFDFEEKEGYEIAIEVNDGNGGTFSKNFNIVILDQEDNMLVGTWKYESDDYTYTFVFNEDLTGSRSDSDGEYDEFTYTYTNDKLKFTSGLPEEEFTYEINGNTLNIFGNTLTRQ